MEKINEAELKYLAECLLHNTIFNYTKEVSKEILVTDIELYNKITGTNLTEEQIREML